MDTVRAFRDRRYEYKKLNKTWGKKKLEEAKATAARLAMEAKAMCVLYDSLQLAHKCILNSFYGYVMRKGARWYSMEMAGVVTYTGAAIIQMAKQAGGRHRQDARARHGRHLVRLPGHLPAGLHARRQGRLRRRWQDLVPVLDAERRRRSQHVHERPVPGEEQAGRRVREEPRDVIYFEVDGPYKAMILPASTEEGKLIKKRYAVFELRRHARRAQGLRDQAARRAQAHQDVPDGGVREVPEGDTLEGVYASVGAVANKWLDMLETKGRDLTDEDLVEYISEATTMSKSLEEYGDRKSCATTCAKNASARSSAAT